MSLKQYFNKPLTVALATVATATLAPVASAATFNFSYTSSTGTITATVDGTLQPDNNTVFVSSISNPTFNGFPAPALPFVGTVSNINAQAVLSLDGSGLDFIACDNTSCNNNGFGFFLTFIGDDAFLSSPAYGNNLELFVPANYSLTTAAPTTVPEPATVLGLLSVAGVGLLCKGRKLEK
ncbi:MAG: PEP-CTERM sorting domain-containing protein [Microcystis aeruginosa L211-101]|nr:PEP-CTERM sorting domain-containing protein [Microcystis aeruginosa L211-11]NCR29410.1 PEP-CTERM sorting domain-containing protein [Microcystis aeruginosa L211-101]